MDDFNWDLQYIIKQDRTARFPIIDENDLELSKEYEKLLAEATDRIRHSERVATKSMIVTTLHHEIRQPLSFIYNTAEMLLQGCNKENEQRIGQVIEQTKRIEAILTRLEKDTSLLSTQYSDDRRMFDISEG